MFETYNTCRINDIYEFPYNIITELPNNQLVVGLAMTSAEKELYKDFPEDLYKLKSKQDQNIKVIKFFDSEGKQIKAYRKYKKLLNIANNYYDDSRLRKYDIVLTFKK